MKSQRGGGNRGQLPPAPPAPSPRFQKNKKENRSNILIITVHPPQIVGLSIGSGHKTNSPQAVTNNGDVDANKGILVDLLNLLVQAPKSATLKSLIFINQIEDGLNDSKGQLISKCPFGVIILTKIPTNSF